jgi:uncharacterized membrane protein (TIGR02234 family)
MGPTVVAGLAGAGLAAVASAQVWGRAEATAPAVRVVEARGADVAPVAVPLALVALAAWGALLVLRRRGRRVVAVVGFAAAVGVAVTVAVRVGAVDATARDLVSGGATRGDVSTDVTLWPYAAAVGAVVSAVLFVVAWRAAPTWPEMSSRYDAPVAERADAAEGTGQRGAEVSGEPTAGELWSALDEGRDPTA